MEDKKNDRRIFARFDVDFSAEIKRSGAQVSNLAQCRNISATGVGLVIDVKLTPDTNLELRMQIPDGDSSFHGLARVVWSKQIQQDKWHCGLKFEKVDLMGIRRFLK